MENVIFYWVYYLRLFNERITEIEFVMSNIITAEKKETAIQDHKDRIKKFIDNFDDSDAKNVALHLGIEHHTLDYRDDFKNGFTISFLLIRKFLILERQKLLENSRKKDLKIH